MDIEKIIEDLNRRFSAPLPEYYNRRIIFWNDEDGEFADKLDDLEVPNVKFVRLTGSNTFEVKKLLSCDDLTSNFLVYNPLPFTGWDHDWLADLKLYSEEFRSDLVSIYMDELHIPQKPEMRKWFKHYRKFFNAKDRRGKIAAQRKAPESGKELNLAVLAAICGLKETQFTGTLMCVLSAGLDQSSNAIYQDFINYDAENAFWVFAQRATGYSDADHELSGLAVHILMTAATRTMAREHLTGLERFISVPHQAYCYDFISDWFSIGEEQKLYEIARFAEQELKLPQRFGKMEVEDLLQTECFPCINETILSKLMKDIADQIIHVGTIKQVVEKRRTCAWYAPFCNFYDGLLQVANMQEFFVEHSAGFHTAVAKEIWKQYTEDYYRMDQYYRQFHLSFQRSLEDTNLLLDDQFKHVADRVEGLYSFWYLGQLGKNWSDVCQDDLAQYGKIMGIPQQEDFYQERIQGADSRVFVVISDAMRYEVAATLADDLRRETQSQVRLQNMQSIFPSITKFGMAALLPHKKLSAELKNDTVTVTADGESTASTNRDKVLKKANPNSVALQYKNIIGMKRDERCALVRGMEVVYIYHDMDVRWRLQEEYSYLRCNRKYHSGRKAQVDYFMVAEGGKVVHRSYGEGTIEWVNKASGQLCVMFADGRKIFAMDIAFENGYLKIK